MRTTYCRTCRQPLPAEGASCPTCGRLVEERRETPKPAEPASRRHVADLLTLGTLAFGTYGALMATWRACEGSGFTSFAATMGAMAVAIAALLGLAARDVWRDDIDYGTPLYVLLLLDFVFNTLPWMFQEATARQLGLHSFHGSIWSLVFDAVLLTGLWRRYGPPTRWLNFG